MDNSLFLYKQRVEQMIEVMQRFADALNHHVIIQPRSTLEDAVRCGFPEDIALTYLKRYYVKNESSAEDMIHYINNDVIPYLTHVAFHINKAMNAGGGGYSGNVSKGATGSADKTSSVSPVPPVPPRVTQPTMNQEELARRTSELMKRDAAFQKNNKDLEDALGIKKGPAMSIEEADKQNANPKYQYKYIKDPQGDLYYYNHEVYTLKELPKEVRQNADNLTRCRKNPDYKREYTINCATCAAAYVLRLRGFDVKAKGNPEKKGNRNTWLSESHSFDVWKNEDGTQASPIQYSEWRKEKGLKEMSPAAYRAFFEENCKDTGVYIVTVAWKDGGGHATILQRDMDGKLYYIEPQVYESAYTQDGRRSIDDLIENMDPQQPSPKGVMRVDNKLFKTEYSDLFEV